MLMPITRDYLEPTDTEHASETKLMDQFLEGWAKWARATGIDQRPTPAGDLWQIQTMIEAATYVLELNDANFILIDQHIARLPQRLHAVVFVEYLGPGATGKQKAERMGLQHFAYRQRLHAAQWALYASLLGFIDDLKANATVNAVKTATRYRR
jgi:hypothetical protein